MEVLPLTPLFSCKSNSVAYERFALGLVLKQRQKVAGKWDIISGEGLNRSKQGALLKLV